MSESRQLTQEYQALVKTTQRLAYILDNKDNIKSYRLCLKDNVIPTFFRLLHKHDLALLQAKIYEQATVKKDGNSLHFSGKFSDIVDFFSQVAESCMPINIHNTSFSREELLVEVTMFFDIA